MRLLLSALLLGLLATPAAAQDTATLAVGFDAASPSTVTGVDLSLAFDGPGGRPRPQRRVVLELPAGTVISGTAVPACEASDAALLAQGPAACPPETRIGAGTLELVTSSPLDPFIDDAVVFNAGDAWAELFNKQGTTTYTAVGRRKITAPNVLDEMLASTPGLGSDGESSVKRIDLRIEPTVVTTPPSCPASGRWTSRMIYTDPDDAEHVVEATTPCQAPPCKLAVRLPAGSRRVVVRVDGQVVRRLRGPRRRVRVTLTPGHHRVVVRYRGGRRVRLTDGCAPR